RRAIHATAFSAWRPTARQENQRKHSPHAHAPRGASNAPGRGVSGSRCAAHGGTASGGAPARHGPESTENRKPSYPRRPTPEDANRPYRARSALSPHLQIPPHTDHSSQTSPRGAHGATCASPSPNRASHIYAPTRQRLPSRPG